MLHGWEKITADERRAIIAGIRDNAVYGGPYHAEFSPTDACNYECFFCNSAFVDRSQRLPWDLLKKTLLELIEMGVRSVRLAGGGEPLIYPELKEFLDLCLDRRIAVSNVTTNAFKLTPEIADRFLRLDTSEIIVSFNDVDAQRYAETNGTTERAFHVVLDNIRNFLAERKRRGLTRPKIIQQFFLWKGNHDQIEGAYDMAVELGVDHVYVRDMYGIAPEKTMTPEELAVAGERMRSLIERDRERGLLLVGFSNERILPQEKTHAEQSQTHRANGHRAIWRREGNNRTEYCMIGWYSTVIRGNGEVYPCCMLATTPGYPPLGNIKERDFRSIWHGENYNKLRDELRDIALNEGRFDSSGNHCLTFEFCAMRDACPFVRSLATPEFYGEMDAALETLRRKPTATALRLVESLTAYRPFIGAAS